MATGFMVRGTPTQPNWVNVIRIVILVLSVVVMGLNAWVIYLTTNPYSIYSSSSSSSSGYTGSSSCYYYGYYICKRGLEDRALESRATYYYYYTTVSAPALMMFAAVSTLIIHASVMACDRSIRGKVFRLGVFIAYIINSIFLLSGWAYMASAAAPYVAMVSMYSSYSTGYFVMLAAAAATVAGVGAVLWILCIIVLITYAMACGRSEGTQVGSGPPAPMMVQQQQKHDTVVMAVPAQPAPVYAVQQPYPSPQPQPGYVMAQPGMVPQQQGYPVMQQQPVPQQVAH